VTLSTARAALTALAVALAVAGGVGLWRLARSAVRQRLRAAARQTIRRFELRLERYRLVSRRLVREQLLGDPAIQQAVERHAAEHSLPPADVRVRVERYVDEIVPFFDVLSYYRVGYNVARTALRLLYRVTSEYQDRRALDAIPRRDVVVYLMNHRSNVDYVVVAFVLARGVSISYAVGEWARVWPLEYVFKSFGAYFVRRRFREPLYHTVLERYVQRITRNGVTQGIFLEGGLSRDGALQPPRLGLLDYIARTLLDPAFDRDIWLVPVAINYDRVLEDRVLISELIDAPPPGRLRQAAGVLRYVARNTGRLVIGRLERYGRVAVNFGTPLSLRGWMAGATPGILEAERDARLKSLGAVAEEIMRRIAAIMPVTPVPLVAAALLSLGQTLVRRQDVLEQLDRYCDHLRAHGAKLAHVGTGAQVLLDQAARSLGMRRLLVPEGDGYVVLPGQRPLLEYYANSVRHLVPSPRRDSGGHPAREPDESLPTLRRR
jgi:glycerol-3-phosphate O-acyltransferase